MTIFGDLIYDAVANRRLSYGMSLVLSGSGQVPAKLVQRVGTSRIVLLESSLNALSHEEIDQILAFGTDALALKTMRYGNLLVSCVPQALVVERREEFQDVVARCCQQQERKTLREFYAYEYRHLVDLHHKGTPAIYSSDGDTIASRLQTLVKRCMGEALRIAREEIACSGQFETDRFAVVLSAGTVRGLSLFSDVDFLIVPAEDTPDVSNYCGQLAQRVEQILWQCGMKPDNLIARFFGRKWISMSAETLIRALPAMKDQSLLHALANMAPLSGGGNEEVYHQFVCKLEPYLFPQDAFHMRHWSDFYAKQCLRRRMGTEHCLPPTAIWLREITLLHLLAIPFLRSKTDTGSDSVAISQDTISFPDATARQTLFKLLPGLQTAGVISALERERLLSAYEFFVWLRNETGLYYNQGDKVIRKCDIPALSVRSSETGIPENLPDLIEHHANFLVSLLRKLQCECGQNMLALKLWDTWTIWRQQAERIATYLYRGDATVTIQPVPVGDQAFWHSERERLDKDET